MATSAYADGDRGVSVGRVFGRAFATIGDNPVTMFGIAFVFGALPGTIVGYLTQRVQPSLAQAGTAGGAVLVIAGAALLGLVFALITQGALVRATVAHSEGRRAGFGESVRAGLRVALPLLGLGILLGLGVGLGLVLFFVPGVMLYIMWSVASPALVEERCGVFGAFGRSRFLTKGARWKIFGLELVVLLFYWLASAAMGLIAVVIYGVGGMVTVMSGLPIWYLAGGAIVRTIVAAIWGAVQTSLYVELRQWKDGPATANLAEIFA